MIRAIVVNFTEEDEEGRRITYCKEYSYPDCELLVSLLDGGQLIIRTKTIDNMLKPQYEVVASYNKNIWNSWEVKCST